MSSSNYWEKFQRARISRRRLLGSAAAAGIGAAGVAVIGCGGGGKEGPGDETRREAQPIETFVAGNEGGTYRFFGYDALTLDTLDPHQTQFGPIYNMHSAVFSRIMTYVDDVNEEMRPDLAVSVEQPEPDGTRYVINLRDNIFFHDNPKLAMNSAVNARKMTSEDVKFSIERQQSTTSPKASLYYRRSQWENVESIETPSPTQVVITVKRPLSAFIHFLADRNAYIVPREVIDAGDEMNKTDAMIGSGPFMMDVFQTLTEMRVVRNPNWYAANDNPQFNGVPVGTGRPFLEAVQSDGSQIVVQDDSKTELAFRGKQKDTADFVDPENVTRLKQEMSELIQTESGIGGFVNSRFLVDRPPYQDVRIRRAIHLASDRQQIGQKLFRLFRPSANVGAPMVRWALPQTELLTYAGYRVEASQRQEDIQEARQLFEAAGAGSLYMLFASIPQYIPNEALPEMELRLRENLGAQLDAEVDTSGYTGIAEKLNNNQRGVEPFLTAYWGFDNGWIHWFDWLYPYFHSTGSKNSFRLSDSELDSMLDDAAQDFDYESSYEKVLEIQRYLLEKANDGMGVHAQVAYVNGVTRDIRWPYVKNARDFTWFGHGDWWANVWLDKSLGRPS